MSDFIHRLRTQRATAAQERKLAAIAVLCTRAEERDGRVSARLLRRILIGYILARVAL